MNRRITVRAVIYKDGMLFALRQIKDDHVNDFWSTPGGGLDPMESLEDGLTRELIEETGVKPVIGSLLFVQQYKESEIEEQLEFFYHVTNADDYESIDLTKTSHGQMEINEYGFIDPQNEPLLPAFLRKVAINDLCEQKSTKVYNYLA